MRTFLYLRIVAIANMVIMAITMAFLIASWTDFVKDGLFEVLFGGIGILSSFGIHGALIIYIFQKYFPDKEVPKPVRIGYQLCSILNWILTVLLLLVATMMLVEDSDSNDGRYAGIAIGIIYPGLMLVQLIGGIGLVKTIRRNARLELESSFA